MPIRAVCRAATPRQLLPLRTSVHNTPTVIARAAAPPRAAAACRQRQLSPHILFNTPIWRGLVNMPPIYFYARTIYVAILCLLFVCLSLKTPTSKRHIFHLSGSMTLLFETRCRRTLPHIVVAVCCCMCASGVLPSARLFVSLARTPTRSGFVFAVRIETTPKHATIIVHAATIFELCLVHIGLSFINHMSGCLFSY